MSAAPSTPPSPPPTSLTSRILRPIHSALSLVLGFVLDRPLRYFYVYGYWRGLETSSICASLSHYDADFWRRHDADCALIIDRQVHSLIVWILTGVYLVTLTWSLVSSVSMLLRRQARTNTSQMHRDSAAAILGLLQTSQRPPDYAAHSSSQTIPKSP